MSDIVEVMALALAQQKYGDGGWDDMPEHARDIAMDAARAALTALSEEGWVVVPKVPTEAMIENARGIPISPGQAEHAFVEDCDSCGPIWLKDFWQAMLSASAPSPIVK